MRPAALVLAALLAAAPVWGDWPHFTSLAASADGALLAAGGRSGEVFLLESSTGEVLARWVLPGGPLVTAVEPLSGNRATAAGADGRFWLLEKEAEPRPAAEAQASTVRNRAAAWAKSRPLSSGTVLTAGGWSFTGTPAGRLEARRSDQPAAGWQAAAAAVTGIVLLPGPKVVTAGYDGTLVLWDPVTGKELGRL